MKRNQKRKIVYQFHCGILLYPLPHYHSVSAGEKAMYEKFRAVRQNLDFSTHINTHTHIHDEAECLRKKKKWTVERSPPEVRKWILPHLQIVLGIQIFSEHS